MYKVDKNKKMDNGYFLLRKKSGARFLDFGVSGQGGLDWVCLMDDRYVTVARNFAVPK